MDEIPLTVGDLRRIFANVNEDAWLILNGDGPAMRVRLELGAAEPFVILSGRPKCKEVDSQKREA